MGEILRRFITFSLFILLVSCANISIPTSEKITVNPFFINDDIPRLRAEISKNNYSWLDNYLTKHPIHQKKLLKPFTKKTHSTKETNPSYKLDELFFMTIENSSGYVQCHPDIVSIFIKHGLKPEAKHLKKSILNNCKETSDIFTKHMPQTEIDKAVTLYIKTVNKDIETESAYLFKKNRILEEIEYGFTIASNQKDKLLLLLNSYQNNVIEKQNKIRSALERIESKYGKKLCQNIEITPYIVHKQIPQQQNCLYVLTGGHFLKVIQSINQGVLVKYDSMTADPFFIKTDENYIDNQTVNTMIVSYGKPFTYTTILGANKRVYGLSEVSKLGIEVRDLIRYLPERNFKSAY